MNPFRLALTFVLEFPWRFLMTTAAMALAAAIVVWVASTYDAIYRSFDEYANLAFGRYQLTIAPIDHESDKSVDHQVVIDLRNDRRIEGADPYWIHRIPLLDMEAPDVQESLLNRQQEDRPGGQLESLVMATDSSQPPHPMVEGEWLRFEDATPSEVPHDLVLREDVAKRWNLRLGDRLVLRTSHHPEELQVIGIVSSTLLRGAGANAIPTITPNLAECFISMRTGKVLSWEEPKNHLVGVSIKPEVDLNAFRFEWTPALSKIEIPVQFQQAFELEEQLDQSSAARNVQIQAYVAIALGALVTAFSMVWGMNLAVESKIQQLGLLRAVGFTRSQVAVIPIAEACIRGLIAWVIAIALAYGFQALVLRQSEGVFRHGIPMRGILWAALSIGAGAIIAVGMQLRYALRIHPLDAISCTEVTTSNRFDAIASRMKMGRFGTRKNLFGIGITFASILVAFWACYYGGAWVGENGGVGIALLGIGIAFLTSVWVTYVPFWNLWLDLYGRRSPSGALLLRSQVLNIGARFPVVPISLSACLGLFLAIHIWGGSMVEAFVPGHWLPDAIAFRKGGFTFEQVAEFSNFPYVDGNRVAGIRVEQVRLVDDPLKSRDKGTITRQDNVLILGIDPEKMFAGDEPLLGCRWIEGEKKLAMEGVATKRGCIVVDHFLAESGLKLGDTIQIVPPRRKASEFVQFEIVGVVELPGWHWQTKQTAMRTRSHRTAAMIFVGNEEARRDFGMPHYSHIWFDSKHASITPPIAKELEKSLMQSWEKNPSDAMTGATEKSSVRVLAAESIREQVRRMSKRWLWIVSVVPLVGMCVAMVCFIAMQIASFRSRSWEIGLFRSLGFQRGELLKSWVLEVALIVLYALIHSLLFGLLVSWCAILFTQQYSFFGGIEMPLRFPIPLLGWSLLFGAGLILLGVLAPARYLLASTPWRMMTQ